MTAPAAQHACGADALLVHVDPARDMACFDALPPALRAQLNAHPSNVSAPDVLRHKTIEGAHRTAALLRRMEADALAQWRLDNERGWREEPMMACDDDATAEERAAAAAAAGAGGDAAAERARIAAALRALSDEHEMIAMWIEHGARPEAWPLR